MNAILIPSVLVSGLQMRWLLPLLATMAALGQPGEEAGEEHGVLNHTNMRLKVLVFVAPNL